MQIIKLPIKKIFLIDDDEDDCLVFKLALADIDPAIELVYQNSCSGILEALTASKPDLLFLDINLPKVNGIECLQQIGKGASENRIPIVMYSSSELPKDLTASYELGATLYFRKPSNLTLLITSLKNILQMAWDKPDTITKQFYRDGKYYAYKEEKEEQNS